jgi:DNA-binding NarL/FixJ family response regulator
MGQGRNTADAGQRLRVFVVEDSTRLLRRLVELLAAAGLEIVGHTDTAGTAIREIAATAPDVVIVDIALRSGSGFDVLRAIDSIDNGRRPTAMVLSNYTAHPYRAAARKLGVEYYFDKSSEVFAMIRLLSSMTSRPRMCVGSDR